MAEDQSLEQEVLGPAAGVLPAVHQRPHLVESLPVNDRLVGALHHYPVPAVLLDALLGLVVDLPGAALDHAANVGLILQHIGDALTAPQASVRTGVWHRQSCIGGRGGEALRVELGGDLVAADSLQGHTENSLNHGSRIRVDNNFVLLGGVHLVAVDRFATDEQALALLVVFDAGNLFGDVLGVHIVHDGTEGRDVVGGGIHSGVDAIQQGDVTHPVLREVPLHVVASEDVVAAQAAQILCNDHIDFPGLNVGDHALEIRAVEVGPAPAVVDVGIVDAEAVLLDKLIEQRLLVVDALGWAFALILL